ncbi:Rieske-like 2Fe-2S protein [Couchioplanes caeruleus]|uniref:Rieske domain-containing protein n=2 Tax=Couchioplanes caeruleus TaxID=56438 RepID=A0A1K0GIK9_9ACTN|nr:hypothetical protein BG844_22625 [Couchioplanes caeruleus subsp. caeruleus]ROP28296.1 Rieske-like 2Fe-2S protein [Couchioplanes caeruleus]
MTVQSELAGMRTDRGLNLAASWYVALPSNRLRRTPKAITLFGRRLVAWRDGSGRPSVMARACPHLGASLADGKVVDGTMRCAFHHWRFTGDVVCMAVPGADRIPRGVLQPCGRLLAYRQRWRRRDDGVAPGHVGLVPFHEDNALLGGQGAQAVHRHRSVAGDLSGDKRLIRSAGPAAAHPD